MKRIIVVFGILSGLLLAAFGAYAVERSTWGTIKASFGNTDELELLPYSAFSDALAKPAGEESVPFVERYLEARKGGKIKLRLGWVKMEVKIKKKALSGDMTLSLCAEQDEQGVPWFVVEGNPHQECDPPAKLKIKAKILCSQIDPSTLVLVHQAVRGSRWSRVGGSIKVKLPGEKWVDIATGEEVEEEEDEEDAVAKVISVCDDDEDVIEIEAEVLLNDFLPGAPDLPSASDSGSRYALAGSRR